MLGEEGEGDGSFASVAGNPISLGLTEGSYAWAETTANLNGTGGDDLVVTASQGSSAIPLLGSSTEFLKANAAGAMTGPVLPGRVATADVDGDGLDDAIPSYFEGEGSAGVGLSDASGNLTAAEGSPFKVSQQHFFGAAIATGDFNGDGFPDIAQASNANTNGGPLTQGVAVLINSPEIGLSPTKLDLGKVEVGNAASDSVTLTGLGAPEAEVTQVVLSNPLGSPFSIVEPEACEALAFEEECELTVEFSPTAGGPETSSLLITANTGPGGSSAVSIVSLSGEGVAPDAELTPASLDFGTAEIGGTPLTKSFTITSSGNAPLTVTAVSLSGSADFKLADTTACVESLDAGEECEVAATFAPTGADGSRTAALTVETDAGDRTAELTGIGKAIPPSAPAPKTDATPPGGAAPTGKAAASLKLKAPAKVKAGKSVKLKVTVTNSGTAAISGLTLTATAPKNLAKAPKPVSVPSLSPDQSATETITVKLKSAATAGKKLKLKVTAVAAGTSLASGSAKLTVR